MQKTSYIINNDKKDRFRPSSQLLEESSEKNDEDFKSNKILVKLRVISEMTSATWKH